MKKNTNKHEMAHLFRTYDHHRRRLPINSRSDRPNSRPNPRNPVEQTGPADSSLIWEVARATSAAPTYFNTIKIGEDEYGDGGFGVNNPSTRLFWEVSQMNNNNVSANGQESRDSLDFRQGSGANPLAGSMLRRKSPQIVKRHIWKWSDLVSRLAITNTSASTYRKRQQKAPKSLPNGNTSRTEHGSGLATAESHSIEDLDKSN